VRRAPAHPTRNEVAGALEVLALLDLASVRPLQLGNIALRFAKPLRQVSLLEAGLRPGLDKLLSRAFVSGAELGFRRGIAAGAPKVIALVQVASTIAVTILSWVASSK